MFSHFQMKYVRVVNNKKYNHFLMRKLNKKIRMLKSFQEDQMLPPLLIVKVKKHYHMML